MKYIQKVICILTFIICIILLNQNVLAAKGTIATDETRIRKEASVDASVLTHVYKTDVVEVLEKVGDWYKVKFEEYIGFIRADLLEVEETTDSVEENNTLASEADARNRSNR